MEQIGAPKYGMKSSSFNLKVLKIIDVILIYYRSVKLADLCDIYMLIIRGISYATEVILVTIQNRSNKGLKSILR